MIVFIMATKELIEPEIVVMSYYINLNFDYSHFEIMFMM